MKVDREFVAVWSLLFSVLVVVDGVALDETVPETDRELEPIIALVPAEFRNRGLVDDDDGPEPRKSTLTKPKIQTRMAVEARPEEAYAQSSSKAIGFRDILKPRYGSFYRGAVEGTPVIRSFANERITLDEGVDQEPNPTRGDVEWRPQPPPSPADLIASSVADSFPVDESDQEDLIDQPARSNGHSYNHLFPGASTTNDPSLPHQQSSDSLIIKENSNYKIVCYYGQWAVYRKAPMDFNPADVDPNLCTHLIYSFVGLDNSSLTLKILDYDFDVIRGGYKAALALKDRNPDLKVMAAIGGWAEGGEQYSRMVSTPSSRQTFIESVIDFMERHGFDGLDLDWEFPGVKYRGGKAEDKENFATLVEELSDAFVPRGWLLSAAVNLFVSEGYDVERIADSLDFINAMTYDLHGVWDDYADHHAPLRKRPFDQEDTANLHADGGITSWIRMGAPANKIVLGIPFYGRSFTLKNPLDTRTRPAISGVGRRGPYTKEPGYVAYYELCHWFTRGGWTQYTDPAGSPYAIQGKQWIGYDTPSSVAAKVQYIRSMGLAGAMIWAIDLDDFRGVCGSPWPLLTTINDELRRETKSVATTESAIDNAEQGQQPSAECTEDGYSRDEENCARFYRCYGLVRYSFDCPSGLRFDLGTLTCSYPFLVDCQSPKSPSDFKMPLLKDSRASSEYIIACYFGSWAWLRHGEASFIPENIPVDSCTHVIYAYAGLEPSQLILQKSDRWTDHDNKFYSRVTTLKATNPDLKILLAVGGWTDSSGDKYSRLVSSAESRTRFATQAASFLSQSGFDGLHLDWQFPVCWRADCSKGPSSDKSNYVLLAQDLRRVFDDRGLTLSANVVAYPNIAATAFDAANLAKYVDFLSVPTFDYHGSWERVTGHTAPLTGDDSLNVVSSMKYWLSQNVPARKLLVGIPFYGQSFTLDKTAANREMAAIGVRARGAGFPGPFTKQSGMLAYYEICSLIGKNKWTEVRDESPYAYSGNQWVSFDNVNSVKRKANFITSNKFGGAMVWSVDMDDFNNMCCWEPFPLLRTVARTLGLRQDPPPASGNCAAPPPPVTTSTEKPTTPYDAGFPTTSWTQRPTGAPGESPNLGSGTEKPECQEGKYYAVPNDCTLFKRCVQGKFKTEKCSTGLHWNIKLEVCDWPQTAQCDSDGDSQTTPTTAPLTTPAAKPTPSTTAPPKPSVAITTSATTPTTKPTTTTTPTTKPTSTTTPKTTTTTTTKPTTTTTTKTTTTTRTTTTTTTQTTTKSTPKPTTTQPVVSVTVATPSRPCKNGEYYKGSSCSIFYICDNGRLIQKSCPAGLHWNLGGKYCDWPRSAACSPNFVKNIYSCDETTDHFRKHPTSCSKYQLCLHGKWIDQSCPGGLLWNAKSSVCDWSFNTQCSSGSSPASTTSTQKPTTTATRPSIAATTTTSTTTTSTTTRTTTTTTRPTTTTTRTTTTTTRPTTTSTTTTSTTTRPAISNTAKPVIGVTSSPSSKGQYKVICYYTNWSWYRQGIGKFAPSDIDVNLCTHVMYGFAVLNPSTLLIKIHDPWCDIDEYGPKLYQKVTSLKESGIKVLIALGGWNDSEFPKYSQLVNSPEARRKFIENVVEFIDKYGFQGLDLDWEYPKCWQTDCKKGPESDKAGFAALVSELRAAFNPRGWLLTAAVSPSKLVIDEAYDVPSISRDLDWIGVMTYDYHGHFDKTTDHSAPLYFQSESDVAYFNSNYSINYWIQKGADPSKLILGVPTYGRAVRLANPANNGIGAAIAGPGEAGPYTRAQGFLAYYEICRQISAGGWTVVYDAEGAQGPYAYKGSNWVSYDDTAIVRKKSELVRFMKLGGAMIWALDFDDFRNACGCEPYPILRTINRVLRNYPSSPADCIIKENPGALVELPDEKPTISSTGGSTCVENAFKSDENDCSKFYHCTADQWLPMQCPNGLYWNKNECDWPSNTPCKANGQGTDQGSLQVTRPSITVSTTAPPTVWWRPTTTTTSTTPSPYPQVNVPDTGFKVICYFTNWAWYRPGVGKYSPDDIDPAMCTHVIYGFTVLDYERLVLKAHDPWADIDNRFFERVVALKKKGVKVSVGLGGWNDSLGDKYSRLVNNPAARKRFIQELIPFIEKYGFDGIDLDWEYPKCWQVDCKAGPDSDKTCFTDWVRELSAEFKPRGWLLSAAVSPSKQVIDAAYQVAELSKYFDWIGVMTYDYFGNWDKQTGHVAPLYEHPSLNIPYFNANFTLHYWMELGADPKKLIMGMPMYGQSFTLVNPSRNGLNASASGPGQQGEFTRQGGFLSYYEICDRINNRGWTVVEDPTGSMGPYAYGDNQWTSFDDVKIIRRKSELIRSMKIGGAMIWALDLDDFRNTCGCERHPLLRTINRVLRNYPVPDPGCTFRERPMSVKMMDSASQTVLADPIKLLDHPAPPLTSDSEYQVVCHFTNWARYRKGDGAFRPEDINSELCTHVLYNFATLDNKDLIIKASDPSTDIRNRYYQRTTSLKKSGIKVLISLGGWEDSANGDKYSRMIHSSESRADFINSVVEFVDRHGFDGLHLDWKYPLCWQSNCEAGRESDRSGFASLVAELRSSLEPRGWLLSASIPSSRRVIDSAYQVQSLSRNLNLMIVETYDYHGYWDGRTGHAAPLYPSIGSDLNEQESINTTLNHLLTLGADKKKMILALPFYGQTFTLSDTRQHGTRAAADGPGQPGKFSRASGFLSFYEICERVGKRGWQVVHEESSNQEAGPYAYRNDQWVSYEDTESIGRKSEYIKDMELGGASIWSLDLDDFRNRCGCQENPLLRTVNRVLRPTQSANLNDFRCNL